MLRVEIDRATWLRGNPPKSMLRNAEGKMCCLGFASVCAGFLPHELVGLGTVFAATSLKKMKYPEDLEGLRVRLGQAEQDKLPFPSSDLSTLEDVLMGINDRKLLTEEKREALLIRFGKEAGIEFVFTG
jgi:hypothetical protein